MTNNNNISNNNNNNNNNNRILLVDDELDITMVFTLGLLDNGFKVDAYQRSSTSIIRVSRGAHITSRL